MAGDGLRRPLNAPPAGLIVPGVQPGISNTIVIANKVIIFGTGAGWFIYSGTPGPGNTPIAWGAAGTTDPYGNTLPNGSTLGINFSGTFSAGFTLMDTFGSVSYSNTPAADIMVWSSSYTLHRDAFNNLIMPGLIGYSKSGAVYFAVQSGGTGSSEGTAYYTAASQAGPWTLQGFLEADSSGMRIVSSNGLILTTANGAGAIIANLSSGMNGGLPVTQLDRTVLAAGNNNTATDITTAWTINAHDGDNGTKYTIETHVTATTGATAAETLTIGLDLDSGTLVPLATLGASFNGSALSTTYDVPVRLIVVPGAGSVAANAQITLEGPLGDTSANRLATNSANMSGHSNTTAFDTTVQHTIAVYAQWGAAGGTGQSAGARWSEFTRSGQN